MALINTTTITPAVVGGEVQPVELHNIDGYSTVIITEPKTIQDGYVRVTSVRAGKSVATAQVELCSTDGSMHICNLSPVQFTHDRSPGAPEITTQAYNFLKTLPEYADAVDA